MPPYSLNHTVCSCRLQCDLSIVYTADILVSRECQELNTSRISVWVYVNHFIWFLFPLLYFFTFFHLCLVFCGQKWCICLWLFPSLALWAPLRILQQSENKHAWRTTVVSNLIHLSPVSTVLHSFYLFLSLWTITFVSWYTQRTWPSERQMR